MTKTSNIFAVFSTAGLLTLLSQPVTAAVDNPDTRPGQNVPAQSDQQAAEKHYEDEAMKKHEIVAKYYENEARKAGAKVKELKLLLVHYEEKSYLYGNKAQDLQAHTGALVRKYEQAAKADEREAKSHRQIALKLKEKNYASSGMQRVVSVNETHGKQSHENN